MDCVRASPTLALARGESSACSRSKARIQVFFSDTDGARSTMTSAPVSTVKRRSALSAAVMSSVQVIVATETVSLGGAELPCEP